MIITNTTEPHNRANYKYDTIPISPIGIENLYDPQFSTLLCSFKNADVARIADTYHTWRNLGGSYTNVDGFCKSATFAEVATNNFVLSLGRYLGPKAEEKDGVPFEENMKLLTTQLADQFEESALQEKRNRENLEGIGFGFNSDKDE